MSVDTNIAYEIIKADTNWYFFVKLSPNDAMRAKLRFGAERVLK